MVKENYAKPSFFLLSKIVRCQESLVIFAKRSTSDVWKGSEYAYDSEIASMIKFDFSKAKSHADCHFTKNEVCHYLLNSFSGKVVGLNVY